MKKFDKKFDKLKKPANSGAGDNSNLQKKAAPITNPIKNQMKSPIKDQTKDQIKSPIKNQTKDQIKSPIKDQTKDQTKNPIKNQTKSPIKKPVKVKKTKTLQEGTKSLSIKRKIIYGGIFLFMLVVLSVFLEQCDIRQLADDAMIEHTQIITKMRLLMYNQLVDDWNNQNVWADAHVKEQFAQKNYEAVPFLSSCDIMRKLGDNGNMFIFRTPVEKPRNRTNSPNNLDIQIMQKLKAENLEEYYFYDQEGRFHIYEQIKMEKHCITCHGDPATSATLWGNNNGIDITGNRMEGYKVGDFYGSIVRTFDKNAIAEDALRQSIIKAIPQTVGFMIIVLLIVYFLFQTIKPLDDISRSLDILNKGEGDLTHRLVIRTYDEIGSISEKFNKFLGSMIAMIKVIASSSDYIADASVEVTNSGGSLNKSAQEQIAFIQETTTAIQKIKSGVDAAIETTKTQAERAGGNRLIMERLTESIKQINLDAQEANRMSSDTQKQASEGEHVLASTVEGMKGIMESSSKIGDFVSIINDISDQINLLSLNASIEAARAGEHGKGFAVVAEEIAKLAEQTASSTNEIKKLIQVSESKVKDGSKLVAETAASLSQIISQVKNTSEFMDKIGKLARELEENSKIAAGNSKEVNRMSGEIAEMMSNQSTNSDAILQSVAQINESTTNVATSAEELSAQSEELSSHSTILKNLVGKFKTE